MLVRPPVAVVPLFARCTHCGRTYRTSTTWVGEQGTRYRRCLWCLRLTKLPPQASGQER